MMELTAGLLNPKTAATKFQLALYAPSADVGYFVQRYWVVRWDLDTPYLQENIPYPCVNLVFQSGRAEIAGIERGRFSALLEGKGRVFGVKFKPGGFYPFLKAPVSRLTSISLPLSAVFGAASEGLGPAIDALDDDLALVEEAENFLHARLPQRDEQVALVNRIIDRIIADRDITRVDDVARRLNLNKRTLQRLFSQYVGVSPKWVIKRYRLHEAAGLAASGVAVNWAMLAQELGYFDQAHFIKDFKTMVGRTPAEYARNMG